MYISLDVSLASIIIAQAWHYLMWRHLLRHGVMASSLADLAETSATEPPAADPDEAQCELEWYSIIEILIFKYIFMCCVLCLFYFVLFRAFVWFGLALYL